MIVRSYSASTPFNNLGIIIITGLLLYLFSRVWIVRGIEDNRAATHVFIHQAWVLKMGNECRFSLYPSICQGSYFLTVELLPLLPVKSLQQNGCFVYFIFRVILAELNNSYRKSKVETKVDLVKWTDEIWREHVDECIANIAFVLQKPKIYKLTSRCVS